VYVFWFPLSRFACLPRLHPLFSLAHYCDYRDSNRDQKNSFFPLGSKDAAHKIFLVICLYVYKRTRQLAEEQQDIVECGRASDGAVS